MIGRITKDNVSEAISNLADEGEGLEFHPAHLAAILSAELEHAFDSLPETTRDVMLHVAAVMRRLDIDQTTDQALSEMDQFQEKWGVDSAPVEYVSVQAWAPQPAPGSDENMIAFAKLKASIAEDVNAAANRMGRLPFDPAHHANTLMQQLASRNADIPDTVKYVMTHTAGALVKLNADGVVTDELKGKIKGQG
jgi:hypothetical protein